MITKRERLEEELANQEVILANMQRQMMKKKHTESMHDRIYELKELLAKMPESSGK